MKSDDAKGGDPAHGNTPESKNSVRLGWILFAAISAIVLAASVPEQSKGSVLEALTPIFTIAIIVAVGVYIVSAGVRSGMAKTREDAQRGAAPTQPVQARVIGFPVVDGPGRFEIRGVDRETKLDTVWHCTADSEANARVKAELEGIAVTSVRRV